MWSDKSSLTPEEHKSAEKVQRDFNEAASGSTKPGNENSDRGKDPDKPEITLNLEPTLAEKKESAALDQQRDPERLERMQAAARRRQERDRGISLDR